MKVRKKKHEKKLSRNNDDENEEAKKKNKEFYEKNSNTCTNARTVSIVYESNRFGWERRRKRWKFSYTQTNSSAAALKSVNNSQGTNWKKKMPKNFSRNEEEEGK